MDHSEAVQGGVTNTAGGAEQVVQARNITGGVHVHGSGGGGHASSFVHPRQLPREVTHFTGREAELAKLDELLSNTEIAQSSTVVISAIAGAAGIGKTSLAAHWAHRAQDQFPDGQLYVNLRGYDNDPPLTSSHALDAFLGGMGLPRERIPDVVDAKASLYRSLLAGRRMLVLLDNAATPDQIRPLLPNEPACRVLVTSRSRLSGLVARDGAHRLSLDVLAPDEACNLLTDIIGHGRVGSEQAAIAELARRCDYLPLALRIAAERVAGRPHHTLANLVHELADEHHRLDVLTADDDENSAVRTVFSWSYRGLQSDTARVFRLLGLQPGPTISLEVATALTGTTTARTQPHLDALVSVNLLTETGRDRYQFHDLLRAYAADRAAADEDVDVWGEATQRLYEWYLHTAHAALYAYYPQHPEIPIDSRLPSCHPLAFTDHDHARSWFAAEHANLVALIRHAPDAGQHTVGWQLPNAVDCYIGSEQPSVDRITVHQLGLAAAQHLDHQLGQRWAYGHLGEAFQDARRHDDSITCYEQSLKIGRATGNEFGEAAALGGLARNYNELGRYAEGAECSQQALSIYRAIGHQRNEGINLVNLGNALGGMGQLSRAVAHIRQSLDIFTEIGAVGLQASALRSLAKIHRAQGRSGDAADHLNRALVHYREAHQEIFYAETLNELGALLNDMGSPDKARQIWREALTILTDLDPHRAAQIRAQLDTLDHTKNNRQ